jgi:HK97 family phage prohead protease
MQTRREKSRLGRPLSACSGTGVFVGYASLFGERDQAGDVVVPGAFARTLMRKGPSNVRMLFQHDPAEPVGTWLEMRENKRGLHVMGRLDCNVQRGRELLSLLESGGLDGLSIGFKTVTAGRDRATATRRLIEVDLWEISLVTFPMLAGARATSTRIAAEQLFARLAAPVSRPDNEAAASLASLFRGGARQFQQGVN